MELKRSTWGSVIERNLEMLAFYEDSFNDLKKLSYKDRSSQIAYKYTAREYDMPIADVKEIIKNTKEYNKQKKETKERNLSLYNEAIKCIKKWDEEKMREIAKKGIDINWFPNKSTYGVNDSLIDLALEKEKADAVSFFVNEFPDLEIYDYVYGYHSEGKRYLNICSCSDKFLYGYDEGYEKKYKEKILIYYNSGNYYYGDDEDMIEIKKLQKKHTNKLVMGRKRFRKLVSEDVHLEFLKKCSFTNPDYQNYGSERISFDKWIDEQIDEMKSKQVKRQAEDEQFMKRVVDGHYNKETKRDTKDEKNEEKTENKQTSFITRCLKYFKI